MSTSVRERQEAPARPQVDRVVMTVSSGILVVFVVAAIAVPAAVTEWVNAGFTASVRWFGLYWQLLLLFTFVVAIALACAPSAKSRLGGVPVPEYSRFKWIAMIMCTLMAGGGVFWAAAEPMYHFLTTPPHFDGRPEADPATAAMAHSFAHWGFLAWAILGSLGALVMLYGVERGMPLRPRTLLYPVMGERIRTHWVGSLVDVVCIIAVVAGTIGPIGFLGLQVAYGLGSLFGIANVFGVQLFVSVVLLPSVFAAPIYVRRLALEQRRYPSISIASANHPTENSSLKETFE